MNAQLVALSTYQSVLVICLRQTREGKESDQTSDGDHLTAGAALLFKLGALAASIRTWSLFDCDAHRQRHRQEPRRRKSDGLQNKPSYGARRSLAFI